jgi:hypothetical protein
MNRYSSILIWRNIINKSTFIPDLRRFIPDPKYQGKRAHSYTTLKTSRCLIPTDYLVEIRKGGALEENQEPEPGSKERIRTHGSRNQGVQDIYSNEQRAKTTRQGIMRTLPCYKEEEEEEERRRRRRRRRRGGLCFARFQCLISSRHLQ